MLPCFSKTFLNMDCLGCGLQRSFLLLLNGNIFDAFKMYPAIYTLLLLVFLIALKLFYKKELINKLINYSAIISVIIIIFSFLIKLIK